jgi:dynein heavy chain, axonemal
MHVCVHCCACCCAVQLSNNEVPRIWASAGASGAPVELARDSISSWVADLMDRLAWVYRWAVDGPPLVWPLGCMARPKAFLTAVQQVIVITMNGPNNRLLESHVSVQVLWVVYIWVLAYTP